MIQTRNSSCPKVEKLGGWGRRKGRRRELRFHWTCFVPRACVVCSTATVNGEYKKETEKRNEQFCPVIHQKGKTGILVWGTPRVQSFWMRGKHWADPWACISVDKI